MESTQTIAIVTCSTRRPRLNPFVAAYVHGVLVAASNKSTSNIEILDLVDQSLPLYDESVVPSQLPATDPTPHYAHQHTRAWSATVRRYDAFIFVTPQYNWSVPASLKNALDYLFHEWAGKPAAIVSYGSRGGGKAADHLRSILQGLRMKPMVTNVALRTGAADIANCEQRGALSDGLVEEWRRSGDEEGLQAMFIELSQQMLSECV
ncbi:flavoprotein-like protein [Trametes meyenii]|nr:flavoprotein-like protein [Trametes meyenii]